MAAITQVVAAVDIGGTRIKAALVDRSFEQVVRVTVPTPGNVAQDIGSVVASVVGRLGDEARAMRAEVEVLGCGVVVPGVVNEPRGVGVLSVNLGWRDLPVRASVSRVLSMPVAVGHDVRAGLLAEARMGAARGAANVVFIPVGTGIAAALMIDARVVSADGWAGELGHVVVHADGPPCGCGGRGCLEAVASAAAVERAYAAATGQYASAGVIAARAHAGEPGAAAVWASAVDALARGIATTVSLTGVELVLLGGGLAESGDLLLIPVRQTVQDLLTLQRRPRVERAALGDRAGCLGAACLAWELL